MTPQNLAPHQSSRVSWRGVAYACAALAGLMAALIGTQTASGAAGRLNAADPSPAIDTAISARASGLFLTGPFTNVALCTHYTYRVEVVSPTSYRTAVVSFLVPPSNSRTTKTVSLVAHKPWHGSFTAEFLTSNDMSTKGIEVAVSVLPPHRSYKALFHKAYPVTPAPSQPANPPVTCVAPPPPNFGS